MHISGKIAAWLVAVGIGVSVYFSARAFAIRDAWMKIAQANEQKIRENDEEIAKRERILDESRSKLARTMLGWDRYWADVAIAGNPQTGLTLGVGTAKGVQTDQVLYVFVPDPNGTSTYLGDYKVSAPGENQVQTKPNSRRRPADAKQVQAQNARVRTLLPNSFLARLAALDVQLLAAEQSIDSYNVDLETQKKILEQTDALIAARTAELDGNPKLQDQPLPEVDIKGLLTAIVDEEEARSAALLEGDRLMRALKQVRDKFARIRKENEERVLSLPTPSAPAPAAASTTRAASR